MALTAAAIFSVGAIALAVLLPVTEKKYTKTECPQPAELDALLGEVRNDVSHKDWLP